MKSISAGRVGAWTVFLLAALLVGAASRHLSMLLNLDRFRPELIEMLENTSHCRVFMGNVHAQFFPFPGLRVSHVTFLSRASPPRLLASVNGVSLSVSAKTLLVGRLEIASVRFSRPRFIVHREANRSEAGQTLWVFFETPGAGGSQTGSAIHTLGVRDGTLEIWDHTTVPTTKWVANQLTGDFNWRDQKGALAGRASQLGAKAAIDFHYDPKEMFPFHVVFKDVSLASLRPLIAHAGAALDGVGTLDIKAALQPELSLQLRLQPLHLSALGGQRAQAEATYKNHAWHVVAQTLMKPPMAVVLDGQFENRRWRLGGDLQNYDATLFQGLMDSSWIDRLQGPASLHFSADGGLPGHWPQWSVTGKDFAFKGTVLTLPQWSAQGGAAGISVAVEAVTPRGGTVEVRWAQPAAGTASVLGVDVATVTIREIEDILNLHASSNSSTMENWIVDKGNLQGVLQASALEVEASSFSFKGSALTVKGRLDFNPSGGQAHLRGHWSDISVDEILQTWVPPPTPLAGDGWLDFDLSFPLSPHWLAGLNGTVQAEVDDGVLREFKTFYRVVSVLNLVNYLKLRFPKLGAQGVAFQSIAGHGRFAGGVLFSDDLFLKSVNMNIGAKGSVDFPGRRIQTTLRIEMFRFLEDILRDVPITHWIFKKPNKIFLPLVVVLDGPWDDLDVR